MGSVKAFESDTVSADFFKNKGSVWKTTKPISEFLGKAKEFDAIFYVGGHGPTVDLTDDKDSIALAKEFVDQDKVISAVCHGLAGLLNIKLDNGKYLVRQWTFGNANDS